jgi:hypothetical protein
MKLFLLSLTILRVVYLLGVIGGFLLAFAVGFSPSWYLGLSTQVQGWLRDWMVVALVCACAEYSYIFWRDIWNTPRDDKGIT